MLDTAILAPKKTAYWSGSYISILDLFFNLFLFDESCEIMIH